MKHMKLMGTVALLICMVMTFFFGIEEACAANGSPELVVSRSGDDVFVTLVATDSINLGGIAGNWDYDETAFQFVSIDANENLDPTVNTANHYAAADCMRGKDFEKGTALFTWQYKLTDEFSDDKEYPFSFTFSEAYDIEFSVYDWETSDVSVTMGTESGTPAQQEGDPADAMPAGEKNAAGANYLKLAVPAAVAVAAAAAFLLFRSKRNKK